MSKLRNPADAWTWRGYTLALGLTATPPALAGWAGAGRSGSQAVTTGHMTIALLALLAAAVIYVQYRLTGDDVVGWLCLGAVILGARCLSVAAVHGTSGGSVLLGHETWTLVADLTLVVLLVALTRSRRWSFDRTAGLLVAVTLTVGHPALLGRVPAPDIPHDAALAAQAVAAALIASLVLRVARTRRLTVGARQLVLTVVLFSAYQVLASRPTGSYPVDLAVLAAGLCGTVLLLRASLGGLRRTIRTQIDELRQVTRQLATAERDLYEQRAQLHEVTNSVAGIASASHLINQRREITVPHRIRLEQMLDHESARLARLLTRQQQLSEAARGSVDLDETLEPLVVAHEAAGHPVTWAPSGLRAHAEADDVAEAVSILLDNARKHAPRAAVRLDVRTAGDGTVEIAVSDDGAGVAPDLREHLFDWGRRGPDSAGQGIGLHVAQRRLEHSGGSVSLLPTAAGTTFLVRLPSPALVRS
ncbi:MULTISPECIES: sensor histidine kinase [unclassified Nocardioides]|uniref:sensor histidine kinase n=1 Tax=unclassified Nocardioides TaxID=2615069 RepID=UPI003014C0D9